MNMVLNNDGETSIYREDSLANPHTWGPEAAASVPLGSVDVLVANPPFGQRVKTGGQEILSQFDLGAMWEQADDGRWTIKTDAAGRPRLEKTQPPEVLFVERCVQFLKPGTGRAAIVLPNGNLNNPSRGFVREWLLRETQILAVVDMQRDLFKFAGGGTDTQTSLLLIRRLAPEERELARGKGLDYPIFMAVAESIGHDKRGKTLYKRDADGNDVTVEAAETVTTADPATGREVEQTITNKIKVVDDDLPAVADAYLRWAAEHADAAA